MYEQEVDIGIAADIGTLAFLPKITGNQSFARELAYNARFFSAAEAEKLGFLSRVVDGGREGVVNAALELARTIASKSPIAITGTKQILIHARDHSSVLFDFRLYIYESLRHLLLRFRVSDNLDYTATWNAFAMQADVCDFQLLRSDIFADIKSFLGYELVDPCGKKEENTNL
jgi:delta(3,5)-delta(2,4)-dienoyl-CoA isomerase